jgi:hypothetical protein
MPTAIKKSAATTKPAVTLKVLPYPLNNLPASGEDITLVHARDVVLPLLGKTYSHLRSLGYTILHADFVLHEDFGSTLASLAEDVGCCVWLLDGIQPYPFHDLAESKLTSVQTTLRALSVSAALDQIEYADLASTFGMLVDLIDQCHRLIVRVTRDV